MKRVLDVEFTSEQKCLMMKPWAHQLNKKQLVTHFSQACDIAEYYKKEVDILQDEIMKMSLNIKLLYTQIEVLKNDVLCDQKLKASDHEYISKLERKITELKEDFEQ